MKINKLTPNQNLLWEGSRMMLPEHREQILEQQKQKKKKERPILDEHKLEELSQFISEAIENNQEVSITVFNPYKDMIIIGSIKKVDLYMKRVKVLDEAGDDMWIKLCDVINIEKRQ